MRLLMVLFPIPVTFGVFCIIADYILPCISWVESFLEGLPLWEEDEA